MKTLWKTLVQPKMDYCSQLWSPGDQDSIQKLEAVQRHFTSKVKGLEGMDFWERLQDLKMISQERKIHDSIFMENVTRYGGGL